jgi:hypothetical protein
VFTRLAAAADKPSHIEIETISHHWRVSARMTANR